MNCRSLTAKTAEIDQRAALATVLEELGDDRPWEEEVQAWHRSGAFDATVLTRPERKPVEAYRCGHCGGIHVGHRPRWGTVSPAPGERER